MKAALLCVVMGMVASGCGQEPRVTVTPNACQFSATGPSCENVRPSMLSAVGVAGDLLIQPSQPKQELYWFEIVDRGTGKVVLKGSALGTSRMDALLNGASVTVWTDREWQDAQEFNRKFEEAQKHPGGVPKP